MGVSSICDYVMGETLLLVTDAPMVYCSHRSLERCFETEIIDSDIIADMAPVIDIEVQLMSMSGNFRPPNPFISNMLKLLENGDDVDVVFEAS